MSNNSENIEERLIPYLEGVLTEPERLEVARAVAADPGLAREVRELQEVIGELRAAFASGVKPHQEEVPVGDVVALAAHQGALDSMSGGSEQKTRLFTNDQAVAEYELLRALTEDMKRTTLAIEDIPPMPDALKAEFQALREAGKAAPPRVAVLPWWKRAGAYVDRLDPRPLMATAAALAVISLGVHFAGGTDETQPPPPVVASGAADVAVGRAAAPPAETATPAVSREPAGVTVFTSGDRELLKEQAEKLLAGKVRYTVTGDRILVAEKEVEQARAVLWGDKEAAAVAMAEKGPEEVLRPEPPAEEQGLEDDAGQSDVAYVPAPEDDSAPAPPVRSSPAEGLSEPESSREAAGTSAPPPALGESSALRPKQPTDGPNWTSPRPVATAPAPEVAESTGAVESGSPSVSVDEERRRRLRGLALGDEGERDGDEDSGGSEFEESAEPAAGTTVTRQRVAAPPPAEERPAAVRSAARPGAASPSAAGQSGEEAGTAEPAEGGAAKAGAPPAARLEEPPESAAVKVGPPPATNVEADARLVAIRALQPEVARRYGVVLSVESRGSVVNVYVRPKTELEKAELDKLRKAIRADLGLAAEDSIIFR